MFVSVAMLIVYGTLAMVSVPFHFHEDSIFATGSGEHAFVQHEDAEDCHHRIIESHGDCTVCSAASHSVLFGTAVIVRHSDDPSPIRLSVVRIIIEHDHHSSHSRRGPPALFA